MKKGFSYSDLAGKFQIYYIEPKGKDISFDRWRLTLYYAPLGACTHFEPSRAAYEEFLRRKRRYVYKKYEDFVREWKLLDTQFQG